VVFRHEGVHRRGRDSKSQGRQARERRGVRFDAQKIEAVTLQFSEFGKRHDVCRAGPNERNSDLFEKTSRSWTHNENAIGQEQCFVDIMSHEQDRGSDALPDVQEQFLHAHARKSVKRAEGFIHEQKSRPVYEHARDLDALLHATGQLPWVPIRKIAKPDEIEDLVGHALSFHSLDAAHLRAKSDVFSNGLPGKQRVMLKDDASIRVRSANGCSIDRQTSLARRDMARKRTEQRRFSAS